MTLIAPTAGSFTLSKRLAALLALLLLVGACNRSQSLSGRSASFSNGASLTTRLNDDRTPMCHVLWVPQWRLPRGGYHMNYDEGGSVERYEFQFAYTSAAVNVQAEPLVLLDRRKLDAGGHRYDLRDGNTFVAAVYLDGHVRVTQIPGQSTVSDPKAVLASIKTSLPADARVQALTATP